MHELTIRLPIVCPECGVESLGKFSVAVVAESLITDKAVELRSSCHNVSWLASPSEREQIREYLASIALDRQAP
jgi:hypothetical protein